MENPPLPGPDQTPDPPPENLEEPPPKKFGRTPPKNWRPPGTRFPPVNRILDTRLWKYYLGQNFVSAGKNVAVKKFHIRSHMKPCLKRYGHLTDVSHKTDQMRGGSKISQRGANPKGEGVPTYYFAKFPQNCIKMKKIGPGEGHVSNILLDRSRSRSATDAAKGTCVDFSPHTVFGSATEQCQHSYSSSDASHCFLQYIGSFVM